MDTPTLSDLGQITITVGDVGRAKAFYHGVLGLKALFDAGPNLAFLAAGGVRIMLTKPEGTGEVGKNSILYFRATELAATYEALVGRGAMPAHPPRLTAKLPDHELWLAFVKDPDGNLVGLMEEKR